MMTKRAMKKMFRNAINELPEFHFGRKRSSVLPMVIGVAAFAALGGVAVMLFRSPRIREQTLGAAKGAYGKLSNGLANGIAHDNHSNEKYESAASA